MQSEFSTNRLTVLVGVQAQETLEHIRLNLNAAVSFERCIKAKHFKWYVILLKVLCGLYTYEVLLKDRNGIIDCVAVSWSFR